MQLRNQAVLLSSHRFIGGSFHWWGAGSAQRFATLRSLVAPSRADLTDGQSDEAIDVMRAHYDAGRPVYGLYSGISGTS